MNLNLETKQENRLIHLAIISFWWLFWLLNVVDKVIPGKTFLWVGKDRMAQFTNYFSSVGIENTLIVALFLIFSTIIEALALYFLTVSLIGFISKNREKTHRFLFLGILTSLFLFTFFSVGDQIFGDRVELLEHSTFWIALIISWYVYTKLEVGEQA